jgi:hypothetical protein
MFIFTTNKELYAHELMDRIMGCDHSLDRNDIVSWSYFFIVYIFIVSTI